MRMYDLIEKKKKGEAFTAEEIRFFVKGFTAGEIPDYTASALLMAICFRGMTQEETAFLTDAMMHSGDTVDLSEFGSLTVDKHSTGGVGDKTTLILAPIVSAAGAVVAKMSGRGLGFTGGTVDKMESVPGMRTSFSAEEFMDITRRVGMCVAGQSGELAPADKKLYALRDATATVDSIPLIASSIMSKKLAAGAKNIVLDVKFGSGAFMKTAEDAEELARAMVKIGNGLGRRVRAVVTDMDMPLGRMIGNALEVKEAIDVLKGEGDSRLRKLCLVLASHMLALAFGISEEEAYLRAEESLVSGKALTQMKRHLQAQGGDERVAEDTALLPAASVTELITAPEDGYLVSMQAEAVGRAAMILGAGRKTKEDAIDHGAGIELLCQVGDRVTKGMPLAKFYTSRIETLSEAKLCFLSALTIDSAPPEEKPLIHCVIGE